VVGASGEWESGLFDKNSFVETLGGWGKTVVVGRARLGGVPCGIVSVETRSVECNVPADPANPNSSEVVLPQVRSSRPPCPALSRRLHHRETRSLSRVDSKRHVGWQAGQVWFPDSAYKTATAINDFNNGEQLPLFVFANWRGFSGGTRDMYNEVLKFGAMIVDALREYKQVSTLTPTPLLLRRDSWWHPEASRPIIMARANMWRVVCVWGQQPVFVYIPPGGELRGGAWVVVDPTINLEYMEMYAPSLPPSLPRTDRDSGWEVSSRRCFAQPLSHTCSPNRGLHVRRER
jgi:acetyl-CoA carboxylase/biotin carboxylase 1